MLETFDYRPRVSPLPQSILHQADLDQLFHTCESATRTASQTNRKFMPRVGDELAFPGPNNEAKLQRSRQNAETQGKQAIPVSFSSSLALLTPIQVSGQPTPARTSVVLDTQLTIGATPTPSPCSTLLRPRRR